ncbi:MAG: hypothetical protein P4N60_07250 [Verrucomicrobiae bacterium]|nr:hypothetical protein [Verrucomicrobiae bacterium]
MNLFHGKTQFPCKIKNSRAGIHRAGQFRQMARNLIHLKLLQFAIRLEYDCDAVHLQTFPVHEMLDGQAVWKGEVEVFELNGYPAAKICYAWWLDKWDPNRRFVAVFEKQPVSSAEMAVKAAVFFNAQPMAATLDSPLENPVGQSFAPVTGQLEHAI